MSPWGGGAHGGALRSAQLAELVQRALPDAVHHEAPQPRTLPRGVLAALAMRGTAMALVTRKPPFEGFLAAWLDRTLAGLGLSNGDLIIYDADRRFGPALMRSARMRGLKTIVLPHKIEALIPVTWPIAVDPVQTATRLRAELAWLRGADQLWSIGTLDCDLLQLFGLEARLLPYAPSETRRDELLGVRASRRAPGSHVLILGTVHNSPTRAGMLEQLAMVRQLQRTGQCPSVVLAGFGTELLQPEAGPGVRVVGGQSWPGVLQLLEEASALWVHQTPMSGAVTRISESLIAGVPVVANHWAARGHRAAPGLEVYGTANELARLLASPRAAFDVPDNSADEDAFIAALRQAAGI